MQGGRPLSGRIRPAGNKNAALPALAATLLASEPVTLENMPRIEDVQTQLELLQSLGASVEWTGPSSVRVDTTAVRSSEVNPELAKRIRASILLAGPLLARFGRASMPPPGGDVIGRRRLDSHFLALSRLGAEVEEGESFELVAPRLRGRDIFLDEPSVTATENAIMAAVLADGRTRLRNVAQEPHVQDLCRLLNSMGAQIGGVGQGTLEIVGVSSLQGACFRIVSDHIETGSFNGLEAVTGGELVVEDAPLEHLDSTLLAFERLGIECQAKGGDLVIPAVQTREIRTESSGYVARIDDGP
ncbi:MAG: UDP-N-acetylglucosamine 1-carboxyvinyltransferase, partial [Gemmatimonadetes bacterium]|nr:UDP-N-acetylglucosamine 1-carboxyvinyltransferase [Gemmatimonadota bacterium]